MADLARLTEFFTAYGKASEEGDIDGIARRYAPTFLAAGPKGAGTFANDAAFLEWLRGMVAFNRQAGLQSMRVASVSETAMGESLLLATVEWRATFARTGATPVAFRITYAMQADPLRILAYFSHEDQETEMRRLGLVPP